VLNHIGREPSGVAFNSLTLNKNGSLAFFLKIGLPHNPMINAGAIMSCSLVKPELPLAERFDYLNQQLTRMTGGFDWGFNNTIYLSEKSCADSNFCLAYMMRKNGAFPENTNLMETLDFYFQACSVETNCTKLAVAGMFSFSFF
jgi:glutaminase